MSAVNIASGCEESSVASVILLTFTEHRKDHVLKQSFYMEGAFNPESLLKEELTDIRR